MRRNLASPRLRLFAPFMPAPPPGYNNNDMKKKLLSLLLLALCFTGQASAQAIPSAADKASAQTTSSAADKASAKDAPDGSFNHLRTYHIFDNLDVAFTLGTTGLGLEVATPITKWASLRLGFDGIPKFNMPLNFDVATYSGEDGNENNFEHVKDIMYDITGEEMDDRVRMNAKPNIYNFKILVDVYPFKNDRRWHFTAGVYIGSSVIGTAVNAKNETNSLVAMNLYNRIYDKMLASGGSDPLFGDIYITPETYEKMMRYGRVGVHIGDFKDGTPYYMTPEANGTVSAKAYANSVRPYLGFGFASPVDRRQRLKIGFDAGALFWGGSPDIILADGVNMTTQLKNIRGKVGRYADFVKSIKVYPAISFRISYTFF